MNKTTLTALMDKTSLAAIAATVLTGGTAAAQSLSYPPTAKDNVVDEYFGVKVEDPYRWLEDDTSARTASWVEA